MSKTNKERQITALLFSYYHPPTQAVVDAFLLPELDE
jgi:hypothetical protein